MNHTAWQKLGTEFLNWIQKRIGSEFSAFTEECENLEILNHATADFDPQESASTTAYRCVLFTSKIVTVANKFGEEERYDSAKKFATWATLIEPDHFPAYLTLTGIAARTGDEIGKNASIAQMDRIFEKLSSIPKNNLSAFQKGALESINVFRNSL